jgi:hypothetical protein
MPGRRRAPGKRKRARRTARQKGSRVTSFLLDMEVPLNDAIHYVQALHLAAKGLMLEYDDAGEPMAAIA